jgi:hypothetical protein
MPITLIGLVVVEYLPKPISTSQVPIPEYVRVLTDLPGNEGALDWTLLRRGRLACFIRLSDYPGETTYVGLSGARAPER